MIHGRITQYDCSFFFLKKKHFCFKCGNELERKKREIVVNSESEEAKNYDFFVVDTFLKGNIMFVTYYFKCSSCGTIYEIRELKKMEKETRKRERGR